MHPCNKRLLVPPKSIEKGRKEASKQAKKEGREGGKIKEKTSFSKYILQKLNDGNVRCDFNIPS